MSFFTNFFQSTSGFSKSFSSDPNTQNSKTPNDQITSNSQAQKPLENVYNFKFIKLIEQTTFDLAEFKNKVILIVNTASKCGFTKQYEGLEKLHKKYYDRGLIIIGVPSADFGGQEFESNSEIVSFCKFNYGVNFLMTQKESVIGKNAHPFYKYAKDQLGLIASPKWNFHKYLINRQGKIVDYFISSTEPMSDKIIKSVEKELNN
ncbi:MAG: glutathione peroxidase [Proteobacteria bacterium]|nr:glutathione peroxidase [Pseudomonadota bacterium]NCA27916.1 glutathione peroxidase [Pseudomonadota bacterium]